MVAGVSADARKEKLVQGLYRGEFVVLMLLLAQYLLGIVVNLFVHVPDAHPGAKGAEYFGAVAASVAWALSSGGIWLALHAGLGLVLVLASIGLTVQAARARLRSHLVLTIVAAVLVLGAGFNGGSFLNYGQDVSSFIMAALWALATTAYAVLLYFSLSRPAPGASATPTPPA